MAPRSTKNSDSTAGLRVTARVKSTGARFAIPRPVLVWGIRIVSVAVAIAAGLSLIVLPVRDFMLQRSALAQKTEEFETLADANEQLQTEVNKLSTPEGIRNAARAQLGYVLPGEQRMTLVEMPKLPTDLPPSWPYTLITDIVRVRTTAAANSGGALAPLAP